jgi:PDZ domain-containing protein
VIRKLLHLQDSRTGLTIVRQIGSIAIALVLAVLAFAPDLPYVRTSPGTAYEATGKLDGKDVLSIQQNSVLPVYPVKGKLLMLTVTEWGAPYGHLTWADALRTLWDPAISVQPSEFVYPQGVNREKDLAQSFNDIHLSEQQAIGTVFRYLKKPIKSHLRVDILDPEGSAYNKLKLGDVVTAIDGHPVTSYDDVDSLRRTFKDGVNMVWTVKRDGKVVDVTMAPVDDGWGSVGFGVRLQEIYHPPMKITWNLDNVGGPSGGLAMALSLYEKLSKEDLLRGRTIAVTGTISEFDGWVDAIGGIDQKIALAARSGATMMLIPGMNCSDIDLPVPPEMKIVPVYHFDEAIKILRKPDSYRAWPTCMDDGP